MKSRLKKYVSNQHAAASHTLPDVSLVVYIICALLICMPRGIKPRSNTVIFWLCRILQRSPICRGGVRSLVGVSETSDANISMKIQHILIGAISQAQEIVLLIVAGQSIPVTIALHLRDSQPYTRTPQLEPLSPIRIYQYKQIAAMVFHASWKSASPMLL